MDIFEYIDRVKANFDKKPEPRYNMKKYFMGGAVTTPIRMGFDKGGMVKMLEYLETLPEDTTVTIPELMDVAKKKRIKVIY